MAHCEGHSSGVIRLFLFANDQLSLHWAPWFSSNTHASSVLRIYINNNWCRFLKIWSLFFSCAVTTFHSFSSIEPVLNIAWLCVCILNSEFIVYNLLLYLSTISYFSNLKTILTVFAICAYYHVLPSTVFCHTCVLTVNHFTFCCSKYSKSIMLLSNDKDNLRNNKDKQC